MPKVHIDRGPAARTRQAIVATHFQYDPFQRLLRDDLKQRLVLARAEDKARSLWFFWPFATRSSGSTTEIRWLFGQTQYSLQRPPAFSVMAGSVVQAGDLLTRSRKYHLADIFLFDLPGSTPLWSGELQVNQFTLGLSLSWFPAEFANQASRELVISWLTNRENLHMYPMDSYD